MALRVLRLLREYHELTKEELAAHLGMSVAKVSALESGSRVPCKHELELYAKHFDVPMKSMLFLSEVARENRGVRSQFRKFLSRKCLDMLEWMSAKSKDKTLKA